VYEELPGWTRSTLGARKVDDLPDAARRYLERIEAVCGVPIDLISTGAERDDTIVRRHPFKV
jgi:adenylosuccinate synthase